LPVACLPQAGMPASRQAGTGSGLWSSFLKSIPDIGDIIEKSS